MKHAMEDMPKMMPMVGGKEMPMDTHMKVAHCMEKDGADYIHNDMPVGPAANAEHVMPTKHKGM